MSEPENQSLREKIENWSTEHAADFPPEVQKIFADRTEEILRSEILSNTIREGDISPDFVLPTTGGQSVHLKEQAANGPVILNFYRGTWCPYCNLEFESLLETMPRFRGNRTSVLAVSPQLTERRFEPVEAGFLDLCDRGNRVAKQFGLIFPLGERLESVYRQFGLNLNQLNGEAGFDVPIPATYIVDRDLTVRYAHARADITERAEPEELLQKLVHLAA